MLQHTWLSDVNKAKLMSLVAVTRAYSTIVRLHYWIEVIAPTSSNYWSKIQKITISRPFWIFFQSLPNLSENCLLVTCITNLSRINEKLFTRSNYSREIQKNRNKLAILNFFSNIIKLVRVLVISKMHYKLRKDKWKFFEVIAPTSKC